MYEPIPASIQLVLPGDEFYHDRVRKFCAQCDPDILNRQLVELLLDAGSVLTQPHGYSRRRVHDARVLYEIYFPGWRV